MEKENFRNYAREGIMMLKTNNLPNAYSEVLEILKYIPSKDYKKIPEYIVDGFFNNRNKNYNYSIQDYNQNIVMYETNVILAVLYRDYWATEKQREKIKLKEKYDLQQLENEKIQKYNPDNLFKNNTNIEKNIKAESTNLIEYKESVIKKIINKIFKILHIKK